VAKKGIGSIEPTKQDRTLLASLVPRVMEGMFNPAAEHGFSFSMASDTLLMLVAHPYKFIEQTPDTRANWAKMVQQGWAVMQILRDELWLGVCYRHPGKPESLRIRYYSDMRKPKPVRQTHAQEQIQLALDFSA